VFQRYVQRVIGARPRRRAKQHGEPGVGAWGTQRAWGLADGACLSSSRLLGLARMDREEGVRGRSGGHRTGRSRPGRGTHARQEEADGEGLQRYGGSAVRLMGRSSRSFGTVQQKSYMHYS